MRVPETMSLPACDQWTKDYIAENPAGPVDAVLLYQLAVVDQPDVTSRMGHSLMLSETPRFETWRKAGTQQPPLSFNVAVGMDTPPSRVFITNGPTNADFRGYHYQRGEYFTAYPFDPNRPTNGVLRRLASGIFQHAVIVSLDGTEHQFRGRFPPTDEITLFE
jgi:hypothetical protein